MNVPKSLNALTVGGRGRVLSLSSSGRMRRRLMDLGIIPGVRIDCVGRSPLGDPAAYSILGAVIAIRDCDAQTVLIEIE